MQNEINNSEFTWRCYIKKYKFNVWQKSSGFVPSLARIAEPEYGSNPLCVCVCVLVPCPGSALLQQIGTFLFFCFLFFLIRHDCLTFSRGKSACTMLRCGPCGISFCCAMLTADTRRSQYCSTCFYSENCSQTEQTEKPNEYPMNTEYPTQTHAQLFFIASALYWTDIAFIWLIFLLSPTSLSSLLYLLLGAAFHPPVKSLLNFVSWSDCVTGWHSSNEMYGFQRFQSFFETIYLIPVLHREFGFNFDCACSQAHNSCRVDGIPFNVGRKIHLNLNRVTDASLSIYVFLMEIHIFAY